MTDRRNKSENQAAQESIGYTQQAPAGKKGLRKQWSQQCDDSWAGSEAVQPQASAQMIQHSGAD